jgi:hypothetical protein
MKVSIQKAISSQIWRAVGEDAERIKPIKACIEIEDCRRRQGQGLKLSSAVRRYRMKPVAIGEGITYYMIGVICAKQNSAANSVQKF